MTAFSRTAKGLTVATLVAGLWFRGLSPGLAQQNPSPSTPPTPVAQVPPGVLLPPISSAAPAQAPVDPEARAGQQTSTSPAPAGEAKKEEPPWSKVPPLCPQPRPGWFLMPPAGEGYYTALDCLKGKESDKAPPYPYRFEFYDNDFRYLDTKDGKPVDCFDNLKRIHIGDGGCSCDGRPSGWMLSIGGEERYRLMNEVSSRLTVRDNRYDLVRSRVYGDLWYSDLVRVYVEYIDARTYNQDLPPLPIDQDKSDLLNAFVDVKLASIDDHPVYGRVGRQELLYGSQRLISPLDWANTRRTFEGAKIFYRGDKFDVDGFWVRPVIVSPSHFDSADHNQQFAGLWGTYRPRAGQAIDIYYLYLDNDLRVPFGFTSGGRAGYDINTFGARYSGDKKVSDGALGGNVTWDFEGAYQVGDWSNRLYSAGMATAGLGYHFANLPMQPQFWAYYDYASGSPNRSGTGTFSTFNQLFPFGHYYFGYLDLVGRENIHDWNFQAAIYPTKWITGLVQYHVFRLDQARDALYGPPPGYPVERLDPTGRAGTNVGQELDLLSNFQLDRHNSIQVGFSKLFGGDFIKQSGANVNPELFYVQYYFRW